MKSIEMKRYFCFLLGLCLLSTAVFTGCNDDEKDTPEPEIPFVNLENSLMGQKVIIVYPDKEGGMVIPLSVSHKVNVSFEKGLLDPEVVAQGDSFAVRLSLTNPMRNILVDKATITYENPLTKGEEESTAEVYVVVQPLKIAASPNSGVDYLSNIGKGMDITSDIMRGENKDPMLRFELIDRADTLIVDNSTSESVGREFAGSKFEETVHSMHHEFGISAKVKAKGGMFSGSFSSNMAKETAEQNKFEYVVEVLRKQMVEAHLITEFNTSKDDPAFYLSFLTDAANDLLNNKESKTYKQYANDEEGIKNLYKKYGTHVITGSTYGGMYIYVFTRKINSYFESSTVQAGGSLSATFMDPINKEVPPWVGVYFAKMGAQGGTISASGGNYDSENKEVMGEVSYTYVKGGNASDNYELWEKSIVDGNSNLSFIGYGNRIGNRETPDDKVGGDSYEIVNGGLIPLYYLVVDPERRAAMEKYLTNYIDSQRAPLKERRLILADFMALSEENNHKLEVKPRKMKGPEGKELLYFPMMANRYAPTDNGKILDTSQDDYIVLADVGDQVWWYALEYEDECVGITDIRFSKKDGYEGRGDKAEKNMGSSSHFADHKVYLKMADKTTASTQKITGAGLIRSHEKKKTVAKYYDLIASTGGFDMQRPFSTDTIVKTYWLDHENEKYYYSMGVERDEDEGWFADSSAANNNYYIFPVYITTPIPMPLKVSKPSAWSEKNDDN